MKAHDSLWHLLIATLSEQLTRNSQCLLLFKSKLHFFFLIWLWAGLGWACTWEDRYSIPTLTELWTQHFISMHCRRVIRFYLSINEESGHFIIITCGIKKTHFLQFCLCSCCSLWFWDKSALHSSVLHSPEIGAALSAYISRDLVPSAATGTQYTR